MPTKNDTAWEQLFERHEILNRIQQEGRFQITSTQINEVREARLMTKFDQQVNLPQIFQDNDLSILPNSRGTYLIGEFNTYQNILDDNAIEVVEVDFPQGIDSINPADIYSEAAALLCAYNSGIIDAVTDQQMSLTVSGRMSTGEFQYWVRTGQAVTNITVTNAQCEIDGGFEGTNNLVLIEAKNYAAEDFLIRQLYYPYRLWNNKIDKQVIPVFMLYSNDVFSFFIYEFTNPLEYNSLRLLQQRKFRIAPEQITADDIFAALEEAERRFVVEPDDIPFPQANTFTRVIDLLNLIRGNGSLTAEQITTNYAFDERQTQYYTRAAMYLGLVEKRNIEDVGISYFLTDESNRILDLASKWRNLELAKAILRHRTFARCLRLYFEQGVRPPENEVIQIMNQEIGERYNDNTIERRSQTVLAWIDWIMRLQHP